MRCRFFPASASHAEHVATTTASGLLSLPRSQQSVLFRLVRRAHRCKFLDQIAVTGGPASTRQLVINPKRLGFNYLPTHIWKAEDDNR